MRKLIICVALAGLLAALCCAAGLAATYGDFTYEVMEDGNVRVTAYNGTSATVVIPGSINGRTVTRVEHYDPESGEVWSLFEGNEDVVSITFPDTVETIHSYGFGWCVSLKEIHLPASIKHIPYNAFSGCRSLTSIVIPEGVVSVEGSAFRGCSKLTKMWLPASLTMFPPDEDWLYYPDEEEDYEYPAGYHLTIYGYRGTIVEKMFSDPDEHVTFVARDEDIRTSGGYSYLPVDGGCVIVDYSGTASSLTIPSSLGGLTVVGIRGGAFAWNSKIVNVVIPGTVKTIGSGAFESCPELTSVQIKEGVQSIGAHAFAECESLETVYMPSSVTAIARDPFYESAISYSEDGVIVPRNSYAAKYCALTGVPFRYSDGGRGEYPDFYAVFNDDGTLMIAGYDGEDEDLVIPAELLGIPVKGLYYSALAYSGVKSVVISEGIQSIADYAFEECEFLTRVVIPASVTSVGYDAFSGCDKSRLTAVVVRGSKGEAACLREDVKYRYSSFGTAGTTVPAQITSIEEEDFAGCTFTSVIIPDGVTSIGARAFQNCGKLQAILIPQGVRTLGEGIFSGCSSSLIVTVYEGSPAATYCASNNLKVVYMD